ncbi:MAG: DUF3343 domain-containing protein, partial [Oscillospiraceae bacterium]|nr:DUF3343 domain-containing protein [Oscillospiraceae bacterium]
LAWAGQDEGASPGEQRVAGLKFWAWYLEQAARLLGLEDWKFPRKAIKAFEEKQELARPVPDDVTMESLAGFLGQGEYRFHYRIRNAFGDGTIFGNEDHGYDIYTICRKKEGFCPKCKTRAAKAEFWYTVNALEAMLPGTGVSVRVLHTLPMFHCPNHPDTSFTPREDYVNPKAALKRYIKGEGRLQALLDQLEGRQENVFRIGEGYQALNGDLRYHHMIRIPTEVRGIRWLDLKAKETPLNMGGAGRGFCLAGMTEEKLEIDLNLFGPHVYFNNLTLEEFQKAYPKQAEVLEDGSVQLTMDCHWVRCWLGRAGAVERVVIQSRFHLEVDAKSPAILTRFLMEECHLSKDQAEAEAAVSPRRSTKLSSQSGSPFTNLTRAEALRLRSALRGNGIKCRVMPVPVGEQADTQLR